MFFLLVTTRQDFRAKLQQVEPFVRDQPFVSTLRSNTEHEVDCTLGGMGQRVTVETRLLRSLTPVVSVMAILRQSPLAGW
jgi:hypothetical protein